MLIAVSGTVVEWFDYSLFFYLATALSQTFYPGMEDSLLLVLGTGAVGFLFRPLGAVVFGHIGDTRGRTVALVVSAGLMSLAMMGIALMPGYATLGLWGGIGVLALRALAGFSVGAEYTGIMVYLTESAKPGRRGLAASWAAANSEIGALLAVGSAALTGALVGSSALNEWAWRIPFFLGALIVALMIPLRHHMVESPVMRQILDETAAEEHSQPSPLRQVFRQQPRAMILSFLISTVGSATYFLTITYLPTYIEMVQGSEAQVALNFGVIAALVAALVSPLFGLLADRIGRRPTLGILLGGALLVAVPGYALLLDGRAQVVAVATMALAIPAAGWSAVAASSIPEQFHSAGRYSGMAVGYNLATVIFGGITPPLVTWMIQSSGNAAMPAYYACVICLAGGLPALALMRETYRKGTESSAVG